jgi:integrase
LTTDGLIARLVKVVADKLADPNHTPRWQLTAFVLALVVMAAERACHHDLHDLGGPALGAVLSNGGVWGRYLEWMIAQGHKRATIEHYDTIIHSFWTELETAKVTGPDGRKHPRQWHQARPKDLERWLDRACQPGNANAGAAKSRNTRAAYSRRVLHVYAWAFAKRLLPGRNPFEDVRPAKWAARRPRALKLSKVGELLVELADDHRLRMMVMIGYYQMLRVGEICRLSVEDFRFDVDPPLVRVEGKGGVEKWMAVSEALVPILRVYLLTRPPNGPLIPNHNHPGEHLDPGYASHLLARAMRPVVGDSGHALRHTGARELRLLTQDVRAVQEALRHASLSSTEVYLQEEPVLLARLLAQLPDPLAQDGQAGTI